jgi:hypothetical protein
VPPPSTRVDQISEQLDDPQTWGEYGERAVETGAVYADGEPVTIHVRKRGWRYELDDRGDAVDKAHRLGASRRWLEVAERLVAEEGFNVNRRGVVFVEVIEGRDLAELVARLGDCAFAVHSALLETAAR